MEITTRAAFTPVAPFEEMCEQAMGDMQAYHLALQTDQSAIDSSSTHFEGMINSMHETLAHLTSTKTEVRLAALSLIRSYWPADETLASRCLYLAFHDASTVVRGAALACIIYKLRPLIDDATGLFGQLRKRLERGKFPVFRHFTENLKTRASEIVAWADEHVAQQYEQLAGDHLHRMLRSVDATKVYLVHPDKDLRRAALSVLHNCWGVSDLRAICIRLVMTDNDVGVRIHAQDILAATCFQTNDPEVAPLLAQIARDVTESVDLRRSAYISLFGVVQMPTSQLLFASAVRFPEQADWAFVDSFLE